MNNQSLRSYALKKIRMKIFPNENISEFNEIFKLPKDRMEAPKDNYWVLLSNKKIIKNVLEHTEKYQYKFINETKYYISFTGSC